jgi:hypothetical protein
MCDNCGRSTRVNHLSLYLHAITVSVELNGRSVSVWIARGAPGRATSDDVSSWTQGRLRRSRPGRGSRAGAKVAGSAANPRAVNTPRARAASATNATTPRRPAARANRNASGVNWWAQRQTSGTDHAHLLAWRSGHRLRHHLAHLYRCSRPVAICCTMYSGICRRSNPAEVIQLRCGSRMRHSQGAALTTIVHLSRYNPSPQFHGHLSRYPRARHHLLYLCVTRPVRVHVLTDDAGGLRNTDPKMDRVTGL